MNPYEKIFRMAFYKQYVVNNHIHTTEYSNASGPVAGCTRDFIRPISDTYGEMCYELSRGM